MTLDELYFSSHHWFSLRTCGKQNANLGFNRHQTIGNQFYTVILVYFHIGITDKWGKTSNNCLIHCFDMILGTRQGPKSDNHKKSLYAKFFDFFFSTSISREIFNINEDGPTDAPNTCWLLVWSLVQLVSTGKIPSLTLMCGPKEISQSIVSNESYSTLKVETWMRKYFPSWIYPKHNKSTNHGMFWFAEYMFLYMWALKMSHKA